MGYVCDNCDLIPMQHVFFPVGCHLNINLQTHMFGVFSNRKEIIDIPYKDVLKSTLNRGEFSGLLLQFLPFL